MATNVLVHTFDTQRGCHTSKKIHSADLGL